MRQRASRVLPSIVGIPIPAILSLTLWLPTLLLPSTAAASEEFPPSVPPPPPCQEVNSSYTGDDCVADFASSDMEFCFSDTVPGGYPANNPDDGQIYVVSAAGGDTDCGTVLVKETGYYAIFDSELSESCADQMDETGYLTVNNTCNGAGWAVERNVGERYLVDDVDNQGGGCTSDGECGADMVCREGTNHGNCCVPDEPVYMGTFLLVAGEENVICIHHWCPEWKAEMANGNDLGHTNASCSSIDSIHFKIAATALVCKQEGYIQECYGGCEGGNCLPHPCFDADCPNDWCVMGPSGEAQCVDDNPCQNRVCEHGCAFGLCLQGPGARGEDVDGDGFSELADCNDDNPQVHPGASEICDNGIDDDCSGFIDDCGGGTNFGGDGMGAGSSAGGAGGNAADAGGLNGGCGCEVAGLGGDWRYPLALLALALGCRGRRRRATSGDELGV